MLEGESGRAGWLIAERVAPSLSAPDPLSGGEGPAVGGVGEAEVEQPTQVDDGGSDAESEPVAFDAAVADTAVAVGDEPGDGPFDEWPPLPVVVDADAGPPVGAGGGEQLVVLPDGEDLAVGVGGATGPQRAAVAARSEAGRAARAVVTVCPLGQVTVRAV